MSNRSKVIVTVGLVTGILFLFSDNYWVETISKPIPVLCMALWLWLQPGKERYQWSVLSHLAGPLSCSHIGWGSWGSVSPRCGRAKAN